MEVQTKANLLYRLSCIDWSAFKHHSADMNTLIALGTSAAWLYSVDVQRDGRL